MIELIYWVPKATGSPVVGITNYDPESGYYYLICESDNPHENWEKYKDIMAMVFRTRKGYHFYTWIKSKDPIEIYERARELEICDRDYLTLPKARLDVYSEPLFILRISPKYYEMEGEDPYDIKPVYIDSNMWSDTWLREVYEWIKAYHGKGWGRDRK